ncbi:MAG TPA: hypothetical protein VLM89_00575 [Phycisphaerae bacterium]|nr:hypothetical protein [Phycisphaerae bacterium]
MCDGHEIVVGHSKRMGPGEGYWLAAEVIRRSAVYSLGLSRLKESGGVAEANAWAEKVHQDDTPWLLCELCVKYLGFSRADEEDAREAARQWSRNRSTPGHDPDQQHARQRQVKSDSLIPLTPEEEAAAADAEEESRRPALYPVLIDVLCCMMCAGGPVDRERLAAVLSILSKANIPLSRREIEGWLAAFIKRVRRNGLEEMVRDSLVSLGTLKTIGQKERIWKCIRAVAMTDGVLDPGEKEMCQRFASVLWQGCDINPSQD